MVSTSNAQDCCFQTPLSRHKVMSHKPPGCHSRALGGTGRRKRREGDGGQPPARCQAGTPGATVVVGSAALSLGLVPLAAVGLSCPLATLMLGPGGVPAGNRTYFPFFSDFRGRNVTALRVGESFALATVFLLALVGNVWGICLLVQQRHRHRLCAANCLVLNLFCADLLFITPTPFIAVVRWTESWVLGDVVCHMLFYVVSLSGTVVILSLSAVSLERVVSIARLRHAAFRRRKEIQICTLVWPSIAGEIVWDVTFAVVFFLIPGLVIVISYSKILQITKASRRSLNAGLAYSENHQIRVSQQDYKLFRALIVLMISFFIMWSPIIIIILLILVQNYKQDLNILPSVFFWVVLFTFANSAVNPILYNVAHFRRKCQEILLCCTGSPARHGAGTETTARRSNPEHPNLSLDVNVYTIPG
ncbi:PREDICTED: free fatty acid receptor 4 [Nipponia nippon]|uniref:free fatty acid receptor 4 n=1 Tax=Nipponia nippon TaxID=128390 RepID=UPI0005117771|nr:PREDICTED: free fatty acid receptor 4 [Nipponia nippon]